MGITVMKCPRCVQKIHRAAESCPHCGFSLADADVNFGAEDVRIRCLTDTAGLFRRNERQRVESAMEKINQHFPQLFVAIYTGSLGEVANIRQFGFWLLNRAAFEDVPVEKPNEAGILITLDPDSKAAGIVFGYLLDPFLEELDTFECLSRAHAHWLEGRYTDGILRVLAHLDIVLQKRSRQARRDPEHFESKVSGVSKKGDIVRGIRTGHSAVSRTHKTKEAAR
ncbi:MAG: hypothetical protein HC845_14145 [Akkermansiaceae bacterium]|nr:hypothetical protein [Akkermansiaceae bacterium]